MLNRWLLTRFVNPHVLKLVKDFMERTRHNQNIQHFVHIDNVCENRFPSSEKGQFRHEESSREKRHLSYYELIVIILADWKLSLNYFYISDGLYAKNVLATDASQAFPRALSHDLCTFPSRLFLPTKCKRASCNTIPLITLRIHVCINPSVITRRRVRL